MSDHSTVLTVRADTSEAVGKVEDLERKAERLKESGRDGAERREPKAANPPPAKPAAPGRDWEVIIDRQPQQREGAAQSAPPTARPQRPDRDGDEFGRAAARQIGKAVAGFALHQASALAFAAARTPGGNNVNIDRAEAAAGGALEYGTMGAMLGGPLGAAIGGLAGAATALARHEVELRNQIAGNREARQDTVYRSTVGSTVRASDAAFAELLKGRTADERAAMLSARREELRSGPGGWSIDSLEKSLRRREEAGDVQSHEYRTESANLEMQRQREAALTDQIIAARMEAPDAIRADELADSYSRRGLTVGGDAATAAMNEQLSIAREQVALLRRIADMGVSAIYKTEAVERAATFQ